LASREAYKELGKIAIAALLCEKEERSKVLDAPAEEDWCGAIWNDLVARVDSRRISVPITSGL
jgi:hypothetical protein